MASPSTESPRTSEGDGQKNQKGTKEVPAADGLRAASSQRSRAALVWRHPRIDAARRTPPRRCPRVVGRASSPGSAGSAGRGPPLPARSVPTGRILGRSNSTARAAAIHISPLSGPLSGRGPPLPARAGRLLSRTRSGSRTVRFGREAGRAATVDPRSPLARSKPGSVESLGAASSDKAAPSVLDLSLLSLSPNQVAWRDPVRRQAPRQATKQRPSILSLLSPNLTQGAWRLVRHLAAKRAQPCPPQAHVAAALVWSAGKAAALSREPCLSPLSHQPDR